MTAEGRIDLRVAVAQQACESVCMLLVSLFSLNGERNFDNPLL